MYQVKVFKVAVVTDKLLDQFVGYTRADITNLLWELFGDVPHMISDSDGGLTMTELDILHDRYPDVPEFAPLEQQGDNDKKGGSQ